MVGASLRSLLEWGIVVGLVLAMVIAPRTTRAQDKSEVGRLSTDSVERLFPPLVGTDWGASRFAAVRMAAPPSDREPIPRALRFGRSIPTFRWRPSVSLDPWSPTIDVDDEAAPVSLYYCGTELGVDLSW